MQIRKQADKRRSKVLAKLRARNLVRKDYRENASKYQVIEGIERERERDKEPTFEGFLEAGRDWMCVYDSELFKVIEIGREQKSNNITVFVCSSCL